LEEGNYKIQFSVSSTHSDGMLLFDPTPKSSLSLARKIQVPLTGGNVKWQSITLKNVYLSKGIYRLFLLAEKGGFNFKSITFSK
jgi:endoglucanase